jgi:hypothetical protein
MQQLKPIALLILILSFSVVGFSQSYSKTIKIEDDTENPTVTISTTKNGKTETVILEGDEASDYIADEKIETQLSKLNVSKADIQKLEKQVEQMIAALDQLEINDKDIKQAVDEIERVFDKSSKWVKKEFPCPL